MLWMVTTKFHSPAISKHSAKRGEQINSIEALGFDKLDPAEITGGHTVSDSAEIFMKVLNGWMLPAHKITWSYAMPPSPIKTIDAEKSFG